MKTWLAGLLVLGWPLTVNVVFHRGNADRVAELVALGKKHGVPTPTHAFMYAALKPYTMGAPA